MNSFIKAFWLAALGAASVGIAAAQDAPAPAAKSAARTEAGEPRADTSSMSAQPDPGAASPAPAPAAAAAPSARAARGTTAAATTRAAGATVQKPAGNDRLDLGTATVTGDREQPKVMYIVPWKKSDIGDLSGKPMNSLLDEALAPVDRDEFKREVVYYQAVKADASQNGASRTPSKGEK